MKSERKAKIIAALNDGTIPLKRYHLLRVGFNQVLYERLVGMNSNHSAHGASGMRNNTEQVDSEDDQDGDSSDEE